MAEEPILRKPITFREFWEYYRYFCSAWRTHLFRLGKGHAIALFVAVVTLLIQVRLGLIPKSFTPGAIASVSWPYVGLASFFVGWSSIRTPVALQKAAPYIRQKERRFESVTQRLMEFSRDEKAILKFILDNGAVTNQNVVSAGFSVRQVNEAVRKGIMHVLVVEERLPSVGYLDGDLYPLGKSRLCINPALQETLKAILD